ncbi:MAG: TIM barrel protein [Acidobacteria bacterium]|nr:TIM barrel protein [Acidobacteriota bacterium]
MRRRDLLAAALGALTLRGASMRLTRERLSVLTDEVGTLDEAIAFAHQYKLKWLEVRAYRPFSTAQLKEMRKKLDDAGLGVSFYNSALLKFTMPGTVAIAKEDFYENLYAKEGLTPAKLYAQRNDVLSQTIEAAQALNVRKVRGFSFWRVAQPATMLPKLVEAYTGMVNMAANAGITIFENEYSTNTGTTAETVALLDKVPGLMLNWDPQNSVGLGEMDVFPNGYAKIPKARLLNVQVKAEGLLGKDWGGDKEAKLVNWEGIFRALEKDNFSGMIGLETHTLKPQAINLPASHRSMKRMLELAGEM